ncbi:MAG: lipocalin family protein [Mycobacterium sp.]
MTLIKWLGPGAVMGGLAAATLCGAGAAGADTGADAGPVDRAAHRAAHASPAPGHAARISRAADAATGANAARTTKPAKSARTAKATKAAKATTAPAPAAATRAVPAAAAAPAPAAVVPSSVPVDPARYAGTYYEQGSVKQFFSIGLVNTKAVYTLKDDGSLRVQNSGNYFFKRGPKSSIVGAAVPVNTANTALNVGFGGTPSASPPGNYLILDRAPDYSWVIVSDPSGRSGYVLTRSQSIDPQAYAQLVARAQALGVRGRITPTTQFPT